MTDHQVPFTVQRSGDGTWEPAPNASVATRMLSGSPADQATTRLIRLAPGHALPLPLLQGTRTLYVVAGVIHSAAGSLEQGDFVEEARPLQEWRARLPSTILECSNAISGDAVLSLLPANRSVWLLSTQGVRTASLSASSRTGATYLAVRADPGAKFPASESEGVEELFILQGSCVVEGESLEAGDYYATQKPSQARAPQAGPNGCLAFLAIRNPRPAA